MRFDIQLEKDKVRLRMVVQAGDLDTNAKLQALNQSQVEYIEAELRYALDQMVKTITGRSQENGEGSRMGGKIS